MNDIKHECMFIMVLIIFIPRNGYFNGKIHVIENTKVCQL